MYIAIFSSIYYIVVTILFALIFLAAYSKRKLANDLTGFYGTENNKNILLHADVSLNEVVLLVAGGACCGFVFIGITFVAYLLSMLVIYKKISNAKGGICATNASSENPRIIGHQRQHILTNSCRACYVDYSILGRIAQLVMPLLRLTGYLLVAVLSLMIAYHLLHSLFGFGFIACNFAIMLFTMITLLVGARAIIVMLRPILLIFTALLIITIMLFVLCSNPAPTIAANSSSFLGHELFAIFTNAIANGYSALYNLFGQNAHMTSFGVAVLAVASLIIINNSLKYSTSVMQGQFANIATRQFWQGGLCKLIMVTMLGVLGIIAANANIQSQVASKQHGTLITYQSTLENGETGYIVQSVAAVNNANLHSLRGRNQHVASSPAPKGIIPPVVNSKNGLITNHYDYMQTISIVIRHYLPTQYSALVVALFIIVWLIYSLLEYLYGSTAVIVMGILGKCSFYDKYGNSGLLWASRISIVTLGIIALIAAGLLVNLLSTIYGIF